MIFTTLIAIQLRTFNTFIWSRWFINVSNVFVNIYKIKDKKYYLDETQRCSGPSF